MSHMIDSGVERSSRKLYTDYPPIHPSDEDHANNGIGYVGDEKKIEDYSEEQLGLMKKLADLTK